MKLLPRWLRLRFAKRYVVNGGYTPEPTQREWLRPGPCIEPGPIPSVIQPQPPRGGSGRSGSLDDERVARLTAEIVELRMRLQADRAEHSRSVMETVAERDGLLELLMVIKNEMGEDYRAIFAGDVRARWDAAIFLASLRRAPVSCSHPPFPGA